MCIERHYVRKIHRGILAHCVNLDKFTEKCAYLVNSKKGLIQVVANPLGICFLSFPFFSVSCINIVMLPPCIDIH
jgi:hypothetical protein